METRNAIDSIELTEIENLDKLLRNDHLSIQDAMTKSPDSVGTLLNKAKSVSERLATGVTDGDVASLGRQKDESVPNYMNRLAKMMEKESSYKDVLNSRPDLLARFYNNIPQLLESAK